MPIASTQRELKPHLPAPEPNARRTHLVFCTTSAVSYALLKGQFAHLRQAGFTVTYISDPGKEHARAAEEGAAVVPVSMEREPSLWRDLVSLLRMVQAFRKCKPDVTIVGTPKAGLIGGLAAVITGVHSRIYVLHGLRLETTRGVKRALLTFLEKVSCACAHRVICVSPSLKTRLLDLGVAEKKVFVLGSGTFNGVDTESYAPPEASAIRELRNRLGIGEDVFTIGFVGRFTRDKGIGELVTAFRELRGDADARLLLVGDFETGDPVAPELRAQIEKSADIIRAGFVDDPTPYYFLMDVLALPTRREGFGMVVLEAQAAGKPVITTTATGAVDSIVDGHTGIHVPPGDPGKLTSALKTLMRDLELARTMGAAGRERVRADFDRRKVWAHAEEFYRAMADSATAQRGLPLLAKRLFDFGVSGALLLLCWPWMLLIAVSIRAFDGAPVLFRQARLGRHGREFTILKFRTMSAGPQPTVTRWGSWLRRSSLDELPQLWNVLRGDISLVGPRPLLPQYRDRYDREQFRRHNVMPGITGWAQVHGRNAISWEEKFKLDVWYVDHWSFWLDMKILLLTVVKVFRREGISQPGHEGAAEFMGSKPRLP